jgi:DNA-binding LytR/AlgR family response regulator
LAVLIQSKKQNALQLIQLLRQPIGIDFSVKDKLRYGIGLGLVITLFVRFFMVGNAYSYQLVLWGISLAFGAITTVSYLLNQWLADLLFSPVLKRGNWTVGHHLLFVIWNFLTIALLNLFLLWYLGGADLEFNAFLNIFGLTLAIGILPFAVLSLLRSNQDLKNRLREASDMNTLVDTTLTNDRQLAPIEFQSGRQEVSFFPDQLVYAESDRNYVQFFWMEEQQLQQAVLRTTISTVDERLRENVPFLMRCHRAFIINIKKVKEVEGNAQGYRLQLEGSSTIIPVSRKYIRAFRVSFDQFHPRKEML